MYKDYQFTKIISLRVEKAMGNKLEESQYLLEEINVSRDLDEKIRTAESIIKKVFGKKVVPVRAQSLDR